MTPPTPYAISIVLHQEQKAGWRIHLTPNSSQEGYPLTIKQAEDVARAITDLLSAVIPVDSEPTTPFMVVRNGTTTLRATLERELADAEAKAANIAALRRTLQEMN